MAERDDTRPPVGRGTAPGEQASSSGDGPCGRRPLGARTPDRATIVLPCPGDLLDGRYRLVAEVGRGSMGVVFRALDGQLDVPVAIKLLPPELASSARAVQDMRREAVLAMKLRHPGIMALHNFCDSGAVKFLVMELLEGETLDDCLVRESRLPLERVLSLARDLAAALDYAHGERVVHRDLKPANVFLHAPEGREQVRLTDFGIARQLKDSMSRMSRVDSAGTLLYMAPEQLRGQDVDGRADVYALAATLYECLCGHPPFHQGAVSHQILNEPPRPLPDVPDGVNRALLRGLAKDPAERFATAGELARALAGAGPEADAGPDAPAPVAPGARSHRWLGALCALSLAAGAAWLGGPWSDPSTPESSEAPVAPIEPVEPAPAAGGAGGGAGSVVSFVSRKKPLHTGAMGDLSVMLQPSQQAATGGVKTVAVPYRPAPSREVPRLDPPFAALRLRPVSETPDVFLRRALGDPALAAPLAAYREAAARIEGDGVGDVPPWNLIVEATRDERDEHAAGAARHMLRELPEVAGALRELAEAMRAHGHAAAAVGVLLALPEDRATGEALTRSGAEAAGRGEIPLAEVAFRAALESKVEGALAPLSEHARRLVAEGKQEQGRALGALGAQFDGSGDLRRWLRDLDADEAPTVPGPGLEEFPLRVVFELTKDPWQSVEDAALVLLPRKNGNQRRRVPLSPRRPQPGLAVFEGEGRLVPGVWELQLEGHVRHLKTGALSPLDEGLPMVLKLGGPRDLPVPLRLDLRGR